MADFRQPKFKTSCDIFPQQKVLLPVISNNGISYDYTTRAETTHLAQLATKTLSTLTLKYQLNSFYTVFVKLINEKTEAIKILCSIFKYQ